MFRKQPTHEESVAKSSEILERNRLLALEREKAEAGSKDPRPEPTIAPEQGPTDRKKRFLARSAEGFGRATKNQLPPGDRE